LAWLDERLRGSEIREGRSDSTHCYWLEGELVTLEDLVLHDAVLNARRRARMGGEPVRPAPSPTSGNRPARARSVVRDPAVNEDARLAAWQALIGATRESAAAVAAVVLWDAWEASQPLRNYPPGCGWAGLLIQDLDEAG
jgi:Protein of unknown function (DUF1612)